MENTGSRVVMANSHNGTITEVGTSGEKNAGRKKDALTVGFLGSHTLRDTYSRSVPVHGDTAVTLFALAYLAAPDNRDT